VTKKHNDEFEKTHVAGALSYDYSRDGRSSHESKCMLRE
jgi:hypothetical protein